MPRKPTATRELERATFSFSTSTCSCFCCRVSMVPFRLRFGELRLEIRRVEPDARAHRRRDRDLLHVRALGRRRLRAHDRLGDGLQIRAELLLAEGQLAERRVDDAVLVDAILDL